MLTNYLRKFEFLISMKKWNELSIYQEWIHYTTWTTVTKCSKKKATKQSDKKCLVKYINQEILKSVWGDEKHTDRKKSVDYTHWFVSNLIHKSHVS